MSEVGPRRLAAALAWAEYTLAPEALVEASRALLVWVYQESALRMVVVPPQGPLARAAHKAEVLVPLAVCKPAWRVSRRPLAQMAGYKPGQVAWQQALPPVAM